MAETMEKPKIYIEYSSSSDGGDPLTSERWSRRTDRRTTLDVKRLYKSEPTHLFFKDVLEVEASVLECKVVFLVVVRYKDGDSFGDCYGNFHFYSIRATKKEAEADKAIIESPRGENDDYRPWDGYFERLEEVEIYEMPLCP